VAARTVVRREVLQAGGRPMYWPGPGSPNFFSGTFGQRIDHMVPLCTGSLLMLYGSSGAYIWEPDASGSYINGRARRIADAPHTAYGGWAFVQNDGKVLVCTGEYGTTHAFDKSCRFDPFTETWEVFDGAAIEHRSALMSDNGTVLDPQQGYVLVPNGMPLLPVNSGFVQVNGQSWLAQSGGGDMVPVTYNFAPQSEVTHSIMPNGWMLGFGRAHSPVIETNPGFQETRTQSGTPMYQISVLKPTNYTEALPPAVFPRPRYGSGFGSGASPLPQRWGWRQFNVNARVTQLNATASDSKPRAGYKVTHGGGDAYGWHAAADISESDLGGQSDFGRIFWEVDYEVGAQMYMPKIGKVVFAGGDGGIWTATTNGVWGASLDTTVTIDRPFNMGYATPSRCGSTYGAVVLGKLGPEWEGKTAATLTAGTYTLNGALSNPSAWGPFYELGPASNTSRYLLQMYVADTTSTATEPTTLSHVRFTSATWNPATTTWTIVNPVAGSLRGDRDRVLREGDIVYWGFPKFESWDSDGVILPNGDFVFVAGYDGIPSGITFPYNATFMKFDGVSRPEPIDLSPGNVGNIGNAYTPMFISPDGTHLMFSYRWGPNNGERGNGLAFMELLSTERTPDNAWRPVVELFPSTVVAGSEVTLTGLRLTGVHEGHAFGDDSGYRAHIPLVRLTANDGKVYYCPTRNYTYRGIDPAKSSSCNVIIPNRVPAGTHQMDVVCNGIASQSTIPVTVVTSASATTGLMMNPYGWKA
jgi:hypothetical protein